MFLLRSFFLLSLFFFGLIFFAHAAEGIHLRFEGLKSVSEEKLRDVLLLKEGEALSYTKLDESLTILRRWGIFDRISADVQGNEVMFHFEEAEIITAIELSGNFPFIENQIRKYLTLHVGDIYTPQSLESQEEKILEFYRNHGFNNTEVTVSERRRPESHGVDLTFNISHGDVLRYKEINVSGNKAFPRGRIVSLINPYKNYSERNLKRSLRKITEFYHLHGYPRARVKVLEKNVDFSSYRVNLALSIDEGPKVEVKFVGNQHLRRKRLLKAVTFFREGSFDSGEQELTLRSIEAAYIEHGYPNAKASLVKETKPNGDMLFTISIDEGRAQYVRHISFKGVKSSKLEKKLQQNMIHQSRKSSNKGPYLPDYIPVDSAAIEEVLVREGYSDVEVEKWTIKQKSNSPELSITIPIELGERQRIRNISFIGVDDFNQVKLLESSKLHPGSPYSEQIVHESTAAVAQYFSDHGYPYAQIQYKIEKLAENQQDVIFEVQPGPLVHIGRILIVGDVISSQKAIKKAMKIKEGEVFSQRRVLEAEFNLRRLASFSSVNIEELGLENKSEVIHLRVKVEEQAPFLTDLEFGYSTDTQYTAIIRFTNLNAFGWAKQNSLEFLAGREFSRIKIDWLDPRFLNTNVEMGLASWIQYENKPSFTYIQIAGASSWFRRYQRLGYLGRFEVDRNHFIEGNTLDADEESLRDNTLFKSTGSVSYDQRDNFADPLKGIYEIFTIDVLNEVHGNYAQFAKFAWSQEYNYSPFRALTLSSSLRLNRIQPFRDDTSVPANELYQLGGDDTIRGFNEDSLGPVDANNEPAGGRSRWIFNQELRLRSRSGFALGVFYDAGDLVNDVDDLGFKHARHSAGLGLRYLTPVGPIRADYGFKLDKKPGESRGRFHFTFGYSF